MRIVAVVQLLSEFYAIIDEQGLYMSVASRRRASDIGVQFSSIYAQLARSALDQQQKLWKATPKFHLFDHLATWQIPELGLSPRYYWCYADEDLVGQLVEVAKSVHPSTLAPVALSKWLILFFDGQ